MLGIFRVDYRHSLDGLQHCSDAVSAGAFNGITVCACRSLSGGRSMVFHIDCGRLGQNKNEFYIREESSKRGAIKNDKSFEKIS